MEINVNDLLCISEKQINDAEKSIHIFADRFSITNDFAKCKESLDDDLKQIFGKFYDKYLSDLDYICPNKKGNMILREILKKAKLANMLYEE